MGVMGNYWIRSGFLSELPGTVVTAGKLHMGTTRERRYRLDTNDAMIVYEDEIDQTLQLIFKNGTNKEEKRGIRSGSLEYQQWVEQVGIQKAPWIVQQLPDSQEEQEFPIFSSKTPCGIHRVDSASKEINGKKLEISGEGEEGTVLVMEIDSEENFDHLLRQGVCMCVHLFSRIAKESHPESKLTLLVWWAKPLRTLPKDYDEEEDRHSGWTKKLEVESDIEKDKVIRRWKLDLLKSFSDNIVTVEDAFKNSSSLSYKQVYLAPWNGRSAAWLKFALANGPIQMQVGAGSLRLATEVVHINRKPLKMFTGFRDAVFREYSIPLNKKPNSGIVLMQREVYDNPIHNSRKRRLIVDSRTGNRDEITQALISTGLPFHELDFHPQGNMNRLSQQVKLLNSASVLITAHGAGLNNAIWMQQGSVALEITLRTGYCCLPIPNECQWVGAKPCTTPCRPYTMVNIADRLLATGIRWRYLDPEYIDQPTGDSMRATARVHVDSRLLASVALAANKEATS
uniref:Glycosyltransferase 61 catalytic domain-containing protein n=1 Tax=Amorphochlora amoebiformis TaxID=1561963 RepID=A0A7S0DQ71_9EUKA|mmetsp:Transcript_5874/g.8990  ORF Transcript_5874/g.8990 Transcript_5874/m.8990 type:complete len:512 (+) Transcript_5874:3-1538(+)